MTTILQINSSLNGEQALSSQLATRYVQSLVETRAPGPGGVPATRVVVRDLALEPVPHLTSQGFTASTTPVGARTPQQQLQAAVSDRLVDELLDADLVVIGLPMYNFGIPSTLKAYFDHVARAGVTFRYASAGPEGLLKDKRAVVFATRGGAYAGTDSDLQTAYVRQFLGFLGIDEVEFVYAEGLAMGDDRRRDAVAGAHAVIDRLAA
jgi:FMN-dependent NADH-azoreductase